jgi:MoxR-like ATPase
LGYPAPSDEIEILERQQLRHPIEMLQAVIKIEDLLAAMEEINKVYVSAAVKKYIVDLINRTRQNQDVYLGASPRGSLGLFRAGQAYAALQGRSFVLPDDIQKLSTPILAHRVIVGPAARLRELSAERIVSEIVETLAVPGGDYEAPAKK